MASVVYLVDKTSEWSGNEWAATSHTNSYTYAFYIKQTGTYKQVPIHLPQVGMLFLQLPFSGWVKQSARSYIH